MIDFNIKSGSGVVNNDIDLILQQIDVLFDTNRGEVLGDEYFGTQYDKYLYKLHISNEGLQSEVLSDLYKIELFGFVPNVEVYLLQGTEQDIAIINIQLSRDSEVYEKTYKIS